MQIEVTVRNDFGDVVGTYRAANTFPAKVVTVVLWDDGGYSVTDDNGNTYVKGTNPE
jgi:hypothetical protein